MRIDIIVPNFDNSSDTVTLSSWYKKVGDRISKNEVIADVETSSVACGITSSYDCVLAKILASEGDIISQESKIAVIETDLNTDISDVIENEEAELSQKSIDDKGYHLSVSLEDNKKIPEEALEELSEYAESQAKEEALELKEKIFEGTRKTALIQAEKLKTKILKECEEKAIADAEEIHKKIVHGSFLEAENTKAKFMKEIEEKTKLEAKRLEEETITYIKRKANLQAEAVIQKAMEDAKLKAESISKEIIEKAITESKSEAIAIKNDIIHSTDKHIAKESMKNGICGVREELQARSNSTLNSVISGVEQRIRGMIEDIKVQLIDSFKEFAGETNNNKVTKNLEYQSALKKSVSRASIKERSKDSQMREETEIIKKLLNTDGGSSSSELYGDNWNKPKFFESPGDYNEPIDLLRRRISEKIKNTYDASVISTVSNEVDMSAILVLEKTFGGAFSKKHSVRLGFTPFFISACVAALKQYHVFNAHIHDNKIIYKSNFDISIITCGNDGIAAPVIRRADTLTIAELERAMINLSKRAMDGTLSIEEVSGGTFTVINAGIYGSLIGTDLLTPPQVATLSVHKMHNRPVASSDNNMEVKPMLYISLSYDHRISDTRKASEFLSNIKNYIENPGWQILDF